MTTAQIWWLVIAFISMVVVLIYLGYDNTKRQGLMLIIALVHMITWASLAVTFMLYCKESNVWKTEYDNLKKEGAREYRLLTTDSVYTKIK